MRGYEDVLSAMEASSAEFDRVINKGRMTTGDPRYRNALFHLLASQTSCYRYWGQGQWTEYGRELCRRQTLHIGDDELIVGERGPRPKGASTYPEVTCHSLEDLEILLALIQAQRHLIDIGCGRRQPKISPSESR